MLHVPTLSASKQGEGHPGRSASNADPATTTFRMKMLLKARAAQDFPQSPKRHPIINRSRGTLTKIGQRIHYRLTGRYLQTLI